MTIALRILSVPVLLAVAVGCQHPQQCPPPVSSTPPTLTSAPVPPSTPPMRSSQAAHDEHVYRLDFVLTPKDPKDPTLTATNFTVNIRPRQNGEVMIGRNVPLQVAFSGPPAPGTSPVPHVSPRQDVGLKVKTYIEPFASSEDLLMDVDLELSAVENSNPVASIRKVSARGAAVAIAGKSALIVSLDDDKRHYELTVTATKIR